MVTVNLPTGGAVYDSASRGSQLAEKFTQPELSMLDISSELIATYARAASQAS
jgi:hypothetical protein